MARGWFLGVIALGMTGCIVVEAVSLGVCRRRQNNCYEACEYDDSNVGDRLERCYDGCDDDFGDCTIEVEPGEPC